MEQIKFYVYKCTKCGNIERFSSDSVAPPEVHLHQNEKVYCPKCERDQPHEFLGLEGVQGIENNDFVIDGESNERYCPLCDSNCKHNN